MGRILIDNFSSGLDDLTRKQQKDEVNVMRALSKMSRYSIFEVTANDTIARMMTDIVKRKLIEITGGAYPWTTFKITEAGQRIIDDASAATQADSQKGEGDAKPLTRCAAARDGDCTHAQCPQLRDDEPHESGRHCPLDTQSDED